MIHVLSTSSIANLCKNIQENIPTSIASLFEEIIDVNSTRPTADVVCPCCGGKVHVHDNPVTTLKDMPWIPGKPRILRVRFHRYRCQKCGHTFNENITFKYPGTRVTSRAALWIKILLMHQMTIKAVSDLTGIHWGTVSKIHKEIMDEALKTRSEELRKSGYRPKHLAVDEFAMHKGHTYATCVMDLDMGDILWVGAGRSIAAFTKFFEETDLEYLSEVEAVAMDMNASFNTLVEKYLPHAAIVYDRYHMQAQYGRDVLGAVRLEEARQHKEKADNLKLGITENIAEEQATKAEDSIKEENRLYKEVKQARWTLLCKEETLSDKKAENLKEILKKHENLTVCHTMKEELSDLFELRNPDLAAVEWEKWFKGAEESNIPQLQKFARLKRKRKEGLIAHSAHPITTGKLEGFNNKIKVAKRIGYGYKNDEYFFTLIRYSALPSIRNGTV
ncbi:MAG: ISL3 family transposase [Acidaminococcus provencensis]|uniref:ISL3 family transposase n=1 Tax=Acidaminococcus provencensis TaxID=2058289 RepID=UPI0023F5820C|nr:ISL3 family transposase [Acidaminococcus provencensis]MCH4096857.1 ISL3 family transposase [Acidaminococcus provencensis]